MKYFKNSILALAVSALAITSTPSSNAALIFAPVGPVMAASVITGVLVISFGEGFGSSNSKEIYWGVGALFILLDQNTQEIEMKNIDARSASVLGLTQAERIAYNDELPRINAAFSELSSTLANTNGNEQDLKIAKEEALAQFKAEISPAAFSATQKVLKTAAK